MLGGRAPSEIGASRWFMVTIGGAVLVVGVSADASGAAMAVALGSSEECVRGGGARGQFEPLGCGACEQRLVGQPVGVRPEICAGHGGPFGRELLDGESGGRQ